MYVFQISVKKKKRETNCKYAKAIFRYLGKMNSVPLRLESILVFLICLMQDTRRKIGSKMHGKKLMINWELKKVLSYAMKRYCLTLCYLFSIKSKNNKSFLLLISYSIFLFCFYHFCICVLNLVWRQTCF